MNSSTVYNQPARELAPLSPDGQHLASILFDYTTTLAARVALGHGMDSEDVAERLESLAAAIRTGDCAESMWPVHDGYTLDQLAS